MHLTHVLHTFPDPLTIFTYLVKTTSTPTKGVVLDTLADKSQFECAFACLGKEICNFFSFDETSRDCKLFDVVTSTAELSAGDVGSGVMFTIRG